MLPLSSSGTKSVLSRIMGRLWQPKGQGAWGGFETAESSAAISHSVGLLWGERVEVGMELGMRGEGAVVGRQTSIGMWVDFDLQA